jgi:hypothetical protein
MHQNRRDSHSGDVIADINYFPALGEPIPKSAWKARYLGNRDKHTRAMVIRDVRTSPTRFHLESHGFQFVQLSPQQRVSRDDDEETVKHEYYPELENIAKHLYICDPFLATGHREADKSEPAPRLHTSSTM